MLFSTAGLLLGAFLPLQEGQGNEQVRRTADAARAIAREFGLANWSDRLIERGLAATTDAEDRSTLLLARCDVLRTESNREVDLRKRLDRRADAGRAFVDYMATGPGARNLYDARIALAEITYAFGADLESLFGSGTLGEEERATLRADAEAIFTPALQGMNAVLSWFEGLTDPDEIDAARPVYNLLSFYRALTFLNWARLYPPGSLERDQYAGNALSSLESFALGAPPVPAMLAYKHIADTYAVLGQTQDAEDYYQYVIDSAVPDDINEMFPDAPQIFLDDMRDRLQGAVQDAYLGMLQMFQESGQLGRVEDTLETFATFIDQQRPLRNESGWRIELLQADGMIEAGRVAEAVEVADEVARENDRSLLRLEANAVMGRAIAAAPPDAAIPLDILFQAAEGAYYSKEYWDAVNGFRELIPRLANSPQADEFGGRAYYLLGASWNQLGFPMLAGLAYELGAVEYGAVDEEYGELNAKAWVTRSDAMLRAVPGDTWSAEWNNRAIETLTALTGNAPGRARWRQAESQHKTGAALAEAARASGPGTPDAVKALAALQSARAAYAEIPSDDPQYYEQALVEIGICEFESMPFDPAAGERALAAFRFYLETYLPDPAHTPSDNVGRKYREEKEPLAVFYLARTHRALARSGEDPDTHWRAVIDSLEGFAERFPRQVPLAAAGITYRIDAFVALIEIDAAEQDYLALKALNAGERYTAGAAYRLYSYFETLGVEGERKAAQYLGEMNANNGRPQWGSLLREGGLRLAIGEPGRAEQLYSQVLDNFSSELSENQLLSTRMSLVDALLEQRKVGLAVPIIEEVYAVKPNRRDVKQAVVKVKLGFLLYENEQVIEVPGEASDTTDPEAAAAALKLATDEIGVLLQLAQAEAAQLETPVSYFEYAPWWQAKLSQGYMLLLKGRIDASSSGEHVRLVESLQFQAPNLGANVPGAGERVAKCFQWLLTQR